MLAALLYCVSFGDRNPRIPFLSMHSRFRRCGISPFIFWDRCGIFPMQNFPWQNFPIQKSPPPPQGNKGGMGRQGGIQEFSAISQFFAISRILS